MQCVSMETAPIARTSLVVAVNVGRENDAYIEQYAAAVIKWGEEHPIKSQKECVSEVIPGSNDC